MKRARGFTLIELMIVVVVIAILAGLAITGYQKQVRKSRRAEAKQVLSDMSLREEKYRSNNATYATCDQIFTPTTCTTYNGTLSYYTVAVTVNTATAYTITGTPKGDQTNDSCGTLQIAGSATGVTKTAGGSSCW